MMFAPRKTARVLEKLNHAVDAALADPEFGKQMAAQAWSSSASSGQTDAFLNSEDHALERDQGR